jgi:iron(III) transport system ATP-binding protein
VAAALEARGLLKCFASREVFPPLSFRLEEGEHVAVTGPSGSGKTTLLRLLAGLLEPSAGALFERERLVSRPGWSLAPHRRGIGMLFQELALWPHLTAEEQVLFSIPRGMGLRGRERQRLAASALEDVGLAFLRRRYPAELSGGERQRLAWARAVAGNPRLLLLDEPLTSLDPALKESLLDAIVCAGKAPGRTLVVVTHDPLLAARIGTRVLRLEPRGPT